MKVTLCVSVGLYAHMPVCRQTISQLKLGMENHINSLKDTLGFGTHQGQGP